MRMSRNQDSRGELGGRKPGHGSVQENLRLRPAYPHMHGAASHPRRSSLSACAGVDLLGQAPEAVGVRTDSRARLVVPTPRRWRGELPPQLKGCRRENAHRLNSCRKTLPCQDWDPRENVCYQEPRRFQKKHGGAEFQTLQGRVLASLCWCPGGWKRRPTGLGLAPPRGQDAGKGPVAVGVSRSSAGPHRKAEQRVGESESLFSARCHFPWRNGPGSRWTGVPLDRAQRAAVQSRAERRAWS